MELRSGRKFKRPVSIVAQQEADHQENIPKNEQRGEEVDREGTLQIELVAEAAGKEDDSGPKDSQGTEADPQESDEGKENQQHQAGIQENIQAGERGRKESDYQENVLENKREGGEAGKKEDAEQKERDGAETNLQENAEGNQNQPLEDESGENVQNPEDLIPPDNELLKSLSKFLKRKNRGYPSPHEYPVLIEFVHRELNLSIDPRRVMERLEALREDFRANRGSGLFHISGCLWGKSGTSYSIIGGKGKAHQSTVLEAVGTEDHPSEKPRGKRRIVSVFKNNRASGNREDAREVEASNQENAQKQEEDQEGNALSSDVDLLQALVEFTRCQGNRRAFTDEFIRRFAHDHFPGINSTTIVTRIRTLREIFLSRAEIWDVTPTKVTSVAVWPSSSDRERKALRIRIQQAIDAAERMNFHLSDSEWANLAAAVDCLYSSGEEDFPPLITPEGFWYRIWRVLRDRSYSTARNWTNAERGLIRGERLPFEFERSPNEDSEPKSKKPKMTCARRLSFEVPIEMDRENQKLLDEVSCDFWLNMSKGSHVSGTSSNIPILPENLLDVPITPGLLLPGDPDLEIALKNSLESPGRGTSSGIVIGAENRRNRNTPRGFSRTDNPVSSGSRAALNQNLPFEVAPPGFGLPVDPISYAYPLAIPPGFGLPENQNWSDDIDLQRAIQLFMNESHGPGTFSDNPAPPENQHNTTAVSEDEVHVRLGTSSDNQAPPENQHNTTTAISGDEVRGHGSSVKEEEDKKEDPLDWYQNSPDENPLFTPPGFGLRENQNWFYDIDLPRTIQLSMDESRMTSTSSDYPAPPENQHNTTTAISADEVHGRPGYSSDNPAPPENKHNTTTAISGDEVRGHASSVKEEEEEEEEEDPMDWYEKLFNDDEDDDMLISPKRSMESHGKSMPASDSAVVGDEGRQEPVSNNPSAPENVPKSSEGTSGSGGDGSAILSDEQNKASGGDAKEEEEEKSGDDDAAN